MAAVWSCLLFDEGQEACELDESDALLAGVPFCGAVAGEKDALDGRLAPV